VNNSLLKSLAAGALAVLVGFALSLPKMRGALVETVGEQLSVDGARVPAVASLSRFEPAKLINGGQFRAEVSQGEPSQAELAEKRVLLSTQWTRGCENGSLKSCLRLLESDFISEDDPRSETAFNMLHTSCDGGKADASENARRASTHSCEMLAHLFHKKGDAEFASAFAEQACNKGSSTGCLQLAKLELDRAADLVVVSEYLKRYCSNRVGVDAGSLQMCEALVSGQRASAAFWSKFGTSMVVASDGEVMQLDHYMGSKFLY
jgi:hypothetical protein